MRSRWNLRFAAVIACCAAFASGAAAQSSEKRESGGGGYNAVIDNIDMLIDNYARFLGRKYDLNGEQDEFTKKLMREKAYAFLDGHEGELRELFDKMFEARTGGSMSPEELVNWGKRVMPIYEEAKKIVVAGNGEWREILNDSQKTIHDNDLKLMNDSMQSTEETLGRIVNGEMTVEEFVRPTNRPAKRNRPDPNLTQPAAPEVQPEASGGAPGDPAAGEVAATAGTGEARKPTRIRPITRKMEPNASTGEAATGGGVPPQPLPAEPVEPPVQPEQQPAEQPVAEGAVPPPPPEQQPNEAQPPAPPNQGKQPAAKPANKNYESDWEKYTREFIEKYKLDAAQTQQAEQILKDSETQADRYMSGKKSEFEDIEKREAEFKGARAPKAAAGDAKAANAARNTEQAEVAKKREALMAPITKIFEEGLKPKLEKLPTRAQRKAAEDAAKKPAAKAGKPAETKAAEKPENKKP